MVEKKKTKSKIKKKVSSGVAHVVSSFNNTIITIFGESANDARLKSNIKDPAHINVPNNT